jgi:hypothetical protein
MRRRVAAVVRTATRELEDSLPQSPLEILRAMADKGVILNKDSETGTKATKGQRTTEAARTKPPRMTAEKATKMAEGISQEIVAIVETEGKALATGQRELCPVSCRLRQQTPVNANRPCASCEGARSVNFLRGAQLTRSRDVSVEPVLLRGAEASKALAVPLLLSR